MGERPVRASAATVVARNVGGDIAVVLEFVEVARDRSTCQAITQRGNEVWSAETPPMLGQRDSDCELDAVHAHANQRVQLFGERGDRVGRHRAIVSGAGGRPRRGRRSIDALPLNGRPRPTPMPAELNHAWAPSFTVRPAHVRPIVRTHLR